MHVGARMEPEHRSDHDQPEQDPGDGPHGGLLTPILRRANAFGEALQHDRYRLGVVLEAESRLSRERQSEGLSAVSLSRWAGTAPPVPMSRTPFGAELGSSAHRLVIARAAVNRSASWETLGGRRVHRHPKTRRTATTTTATTATFSTA